MHPISFIGILKTGNKGKIFNFGFPEILSVNNARDWVGQKITVGFQKELETSHRSKMADREELEFNTTKRARWSSESSCGHDLSFIDSNEKREPRDDSLSRTIESEHSVSFENVSSEMISREQNGGLVSHERLESDDFPTCFSVEDDLNDLDEHHFQPVAGNTCF